MEVVEPVRFADKAFNRDMKELPSLSRRVIGVEEDGLEEEEEMAREDKSRAAEADEELSGARLRGEEVGWVVCVGSCLVECSSSSDEASKLFCR